MAIAFTWGSTQISYALIAYAFTSICLGLFIIKYMYTLNKPISAMIILILLILIFIFFGKRWFVNGQLKGTTAATTAAASATASASASAASGQCGGSSTPTSSPTFWPPIVNACPDFMTINSAGACVDTNALYGNGTLTFPTSQAPATTCNLLQNADTTKNAYLRWEGVTEADGTCKVSNIGRSPSM